jgi:hypothetical protein
MCRIRGHQRPRREVGSGTQGTVEELVWVGGGELRVSIAGKFSHVQWSVMTGHRQLPLTLPLSIPSNPLFVLADSRGSLFLAILSYFLL